MIIKRDGARLAIAQGKGPIYFKPMHQGLPTLFGFTVPSREGGRAVSVELTQEEITALVEIWKHGGLVL
jgi:hypothetical protein